MPAHCREARVELRASVVGVDANVDIGARRAVSGLLTSVSRDIATSPEGLASAATVVGVAGERPPGQAAVDLAINELSTHPATDLDAHIGARHIVESRPVEAADLHVFDRLGLNGKISCLPRRNRNQRRRGAEEEAFHHLHLNLQLLPWEGSDSAG